MPPHSAFNIGTGDLNLGLPHACAIGTLSEESSTQSPQLAYYVSSGD